MRILIIEDSDSICRMIEALVSARGYEVISAASGARGLELAFEKAPDVVLLDLNLPGSFDGFDVTRKIRESESTKNVPVVIISAMSDEDSKVKAHEAGATAYYTKPFSPISLLKEIDTLRAKRPA
jgi:DNA-binding response OmpR family regulator